MHASPVHTPHVVVRRDTHHYACTRHAIDALQLPSLKGKRTLIKPNAGRHVAPQKGINTNPTVVAAVCDALRDKGADIAIGEGTIVGQKPLECMEETGISAVARERDIPLIDLDAAPPDKRVFSHGHILSHLVVSGALRAFDYIVSVPVMKTHMHCRVSLSLKNMKGCLRGHEKVRLHQLPAQQISDGNKTLDVAIADLSTILVPDLAVIDATYAQEGLGPSGGTVKQCDMVIASPHFLYADAVAARLMGFDPQEIPHLSLAAARAHVTLSCKEIEIDPPDWRTYAHTFAPPPQKISIEFPHVTVLDDESCSACVSTLLMFLHRYYAEIGEYLPLTIAIGKGHTSVPPGTLNIGNCTACAARASTQSYCKGCPPVASEILRSLTDISGTAE